MENFLSHYAQTYGYQQRTVKSQAQKRLMQYAWPGNVRELKNLAERIAILGGPVIDVEDLPSHLQEKRALIDIKAMGNRTLKEVREEVERSYILLKLKEHQWNISRTAEALGIERTNLHKKMKSYELQRPSN